MVIMSKPFSFLNSCLYIFFDFQRCFLFAFWFIFYRELFSVAYRTVAIRVYFQKVGVA